MYSRDFLVNGHFTLEPRVVLSTSAKINREKPKMAERRVFRYPKAPKLETDIEIEELEAEIGPIGRDSEVYKSLSFLRPHRKF